MMLNSLLAPSAAAAAFANSQTYNPLSHQYPNGRFWMDTALSPSSTSSSAMVTNTLTSTTSTSSLSPASFIPDHVNHLHQSASLYPSTALQQQCSSLLNQIHLHSSGNSSSAYHEAIMARHYSTPQQSMIEGSTTSFSTLAGSHSNHPNFNNPFHRLAEAIVATAKPQSVHVHAHHHRHHSHHQRRSQSAIQSSKSGSNCSSHKSSEMSTDKVGDGGSLLNVHHHYQLSGNVLLGNRQLPPLPSHNHSQQCSIFDHRRAKRPLTAIELERKRDLANKQERRRMHRLNDALNRLRELIPVDELFGSSPGQAKTNYRRLSKIKTLQSAIAYIRSLEEMLGEENEQEEEKPRFEDLL